MVAEGVEMHDSIIIVISPAKTLDLKPLPPQVEEEILLQYGEAHRPLYCDEIKTHHIAEAMKSRSAKELSKLLSCSNSLAAIAKTYWDGLELTTVETAKKEEKEDQEKGKPALFMFDGPAYKGISINSCSQRQQLNTIITYLQQHLRILDPLYGCLKPLDMIQPYRLEMATKDVSKNIGKDLAAYWRESITNYITKEFSSMDSNKSYSNNKHRHNRRCLLINLASDEYFTAIDTTKLLSSSDITVVKIIFQQEGRVISTHAKRARGLMVKFLAENNVSSLEEIKKFTVEGYLFVDDKSDESTLVFNRKKQQHVDNTQLSKKRKRPKS